MRPTLNIHIFCLDDHEATLSAIAEYFSLRGIKNLSLFSDEDDFLNSLDENVHIAIIDYWLGGNRTGMDVCRKLIEKNPQCFVIIISAQTNEDVIIDLKNSDADRYVSKMKVNWLDELYNFVEEGIKRVQADLDWYYNLIHKLESSPNPNENKSVPNELTQH